MPAERLDELPERANVFIDANILIYALTGKSSECLRFLERCAREDVTGVTSLGVIHEATHRLMLLEAAEQRIISVARADLLRKHRNRIPELRQYWQRIEYVLDLNLLILETTVSIARQAHVIRNTSCILTNDSLVIACMRECGLSALASADEDFSSVSGLSLFLPEDL